MRSLSVITPCFNEEGNVREVYDRTRAVMVKLGRYQYEHVFIDNRSTDNTWAVLKEIAASDRNVKIIRNTRNFGHLRSPFHALLQARGDAVIVLLSDLQDPPELIENFVQEWEKGFDVVVAIKHESRENALMYWGRSQYYKLVRNISSIEVYEHFTGFGLYDRKVMDMVKQFPDSYPNFRGMIAEIGLPRSEIRYTQERRKSGKSKNNWFALFDMGMLGLTSLSKVPLRLATFAGFAGAAISFLFGLAYFVYKILYWQRFTVGIAPLVIGVFFLGSMQMVFLGIIGEYVGNIFTQVQARPYVFEDERINFEYPAGEPMRESIARKASRT